MNDSVNKQITIERLRARLEKIEFDRNLKIEVLRAEVMTWRAWFDDKDGRWTSGLSKLADAMNNTDAAKALEKE